MIGIEKRSTIRLDIKQELALIGADPIHRLGRQIASAKRKGDRAEAIQGLKHFLESSRRKRHKHRDAHSG